METKRAVLHCYGKPECLHYSPSAIIHLVGIPRFALIEKVVLGQGHSFFTSNLQSSWHAFGKLMELEEVHLSHEGSIAGGSSEIRWISSCWSPSAA